MSIETTYASLIHLPWHRLSIAYVFGAVALQTIYSLPFIWRRVCLFVGLHKNEEQGVNWGTDALYKLPFSVLERRAKQKPDEQVLH
jgi:hypothetical protein